MAAKILPMSEQKTSTFTSYQKLVILLLALTQFSVILDFMVMSPLGDILMKSLSLSPKEFAVVVSAYALSAGVSGLLTAGFADKFDRKKLLLFFYVGFILGTVFCGLSHTYVELVAARIITGIFGGVISSIGMAIITDLFSLQQRGRVMGFVQMAFGASQVLGVPIGLYLANLWGWEAPFWLVVGIAVVTAFFIAIRLRPVTEHLSLKKEKTALAHLLHTVKQKKHRIGFTSTALLSIGGFMMMPFGSAFAVNNLGITENQLPMLFMVSGLSSLIILPMIGKLSDKISKLKIFTVASLWMMVMCVIYTNLSITPFLAVILVNILMMMGVMSRMIPSQALTSAIPEPQDRGAFMSINTSLQQIAGGIASIAAGLIVTSKGKGQPLEHYDMVAYVIVVIGFISIWLMGRVNKIVEAKTTKMPTSAPVIEH